MNILSLFDGISCARLACIRAGININNYYASEIDKYAIQVALKNFPDTIQLGDICEIDGTQYSNIDLLVAGFPCQAWSSAGKHLGLKDDRGQLALETLRVWKEVNPKYFLFENVASMSKKNRAYFDELFGVKSILLNSSLVSAQNRKRLFWTNIPNITEPTDKKILLKDIIEHGIVDRDKSFCIDANYFKETNAKQYFEKHRQQAVFEFKNGNNILICRDQGRKLDPSYSKRDDKNGTIQRGYEISNEGKSFTLTASNINDNLILENLTIRKLSVIEAERLQTLPDNYTEGISNSQRYKCLGNGFTVDIIAHILTHIDK